MSEAKWACIAIVSVALAMFGLVAATEYRSVKKYEACIARFTPTECAQR